MKRFLQYALVFGLMSCASAVKADEPEIALDPIVITPYRYGESLNKTAANVSVVTSQDIENSNAQTIVDVLKPISEVTVRDYYGNGAVATVDISGFGEQGPLNVLVLVDGRRVNDVDLSGVDWRQIPLDRVERLEIMRGPSASVLYGDNAAGGVINIITRKGSGVLKVKTSAEYGSYNTNRQKISLEGALRQKFSYSFTAAHDGSNGYRANTFEKNKDFASNLAYDFTDAFSMHFDSGFHAASYGMPSGLFQHHIDEFGRRWARYSDDHVNNQDFYFVLGAKNDFADAGYFDLDFNYRKKNADSFFLSSHNDTHKNTIETLGLLPKYTLKSSLLNHKNQMIVGIDFYRVFYHSNNYDFANDRNLKNFTTIRKDSVGSYWQDEFSLTEQWVFVSGYRYEATRYVFGYHDFTGFNPDRDAQLRPREQAFNTGLAYNYRDESCLFFNAGRSFRFPEVDEFTGMYDINFHQFLNTNLKPQSDMNYQLGVRHKFSDRLRGSLSFYRMNIRDYIYFNPIGGTFGFGENENYDKTIHEGLDSSFETKLNSSVIFFGNYSFTKAFFDGGIYNKNDIPMVPRHKGSVGLRFLLPKATTLNILGTYVGKRYFINDQANAVSPLNGYMVADINVAWRYKDLTITFFINNLFDKQYAQFGVYGTDSSRAFVLDKCYFPSPGRNYSLKVEYTF